ncbi:hypothetical protein GLX30_30165 [Streptomyces sp. Tu 2975]|uniref:hypothetical protein n=1 Tax=Streptomyces sp. Tu 2975 TaxID=2676871 RepID=UPI00135834D4|nr:hypothetical protein [Streptomyces sp. Tu 2975]QIP87583.1 hypothetical protein GLX30_30165 [Streptomyces sp. Tu 2975]
MSTFSQNPELPSDFDQIMCGVPVLSAWEAMFTEAEETLLASRLGEFQVEEIGRTAFNSLPESEKEAALDVLFYTYWSARQDQLDARARSQAGE